MAQTAATAAAHAERVLARLRAEIVAKGPLDFARYMELALHAPGLGYYSAGASKFGAGGDFVTAPELGDVYARCIAHAIAPALRETTGEMLEIGAGSGALAADALSELKRLDALPMRYRILETSADLRERQSACLRERVPVLASRVSWLDAPPAEPWRGVLFANEVIDALPVRRFVVQADGSVHAEAVDADAHGGLIRRDVPADAALVQAAMQLEHQCGPWPRPYRSEWNALLPAWITAITASLARGLVLLVDYGHPRHEYYAPARRDGTLRGFHRHRVVGDPLATPGLMDLTASVDFSAVAEAGVDAGLVLGGYASQAAFLLANGLPQILAAADPADARALARLAAQVKTLTLPDEMGERFAAITFLRGLDATLSPLAGIDQRHRLQVPLPP
jgi:SAM-dependent MidA family methyltransferase